jgi:hypothetical protein
MGSVRLVLRADLRGRWRPLLGLALLLGLIGGVVLTAATGARRTDTAYPRLLRWASASQVDIIPARTGQTGFYAALRRLPQVAAMSVEGLYQMALPVRHGLPTAPVETLSSTDGLMGTSVDRVKIVAGHPFRRGPGGQAMVDRRLALQEHLRPGSILRLLAVPNDPSTGIPDLRHAVPLSFRVSAVVVFDTQIVPATKTYGLPTALLSPPFTSTRMARSTSYGDQAAVRLAPGASLAAFQATASRLAAQYPGTGKLNIVDLSDGVTATQNAIHPVAVALAAFAALTGLIALAVIGQLLSRQLTLDAAEFPILRSLGMTRARLAGLSLVRMSLPTVTGGLLSVVIAIAASPLMPIGPARLAEPSPGMTVNLAFLGAGFALIALLPLVVAAPSAWRAAARAGGPSGVAEPAAAARPSRVGPALGVAGSVTGGVGVRMAFEPGHGRTAVPVRSAVASITIAVAAVTASAIFGASLVGLVSAPARYGQNWAGQLDFGFGAAPPGLASQIMKTQRAVTGYAAGDYGQVTMDGRTIAAVGIDPLRGHGYLTMLTGTAPTGPGEIAFGEQTLRALHRQVGDTVRILINGRARLMRISGEAVFASFSRGGFAATGLGTGAATSASVLSVPFSPTGCVHGDTCYNFVLMRMRPGTDTRRVAQRLQAAAIRSGCPIGSCAVSTDQRPSDIRNDTGVRDTPLILGAVLALLGIGTLAHVLLTSVRRHRRNLAVLKTLGLRRRQVLGVVLWQADALAAVALALGLPLGILAGRWSWALFARSLGVAATPAIPAPLILAAIPVTLLLAILIAAGPGRAAARIRPAVVLRAE